MSGTAPTYEYYSTAFGGALDEDEFSASLSKAVARVNARCCLFDVESLTGKELDAYQRAICIACDGISDPAVSSYSASKVSETFVDAESRSVDEMIEQCLSGTRLVECAL